MLTLADFLKDDSSLVPMALPRDFPIEAEPPNFASKTRSAPAMAMTRAGNVPVPPPRPLPPRSVDLPVPPPPVDDLISFGVSECLARENCDNGRSGFDPHIGRPNDSNSTVLDRACEEALQQRRRRRDVQSVPSNCASNAGAKVLAASCPKASSLSLPTPLVGCVVRTTYGWGIVTEDDPSSLQVRVALDWRLRDGRRARATVQRADVLERSFCAVGQCVETLFGSGVLVDFRREDRQHVVRLWRARGAGSSILYCRASSLTRVLRSAVGFVAETPYGRGVTRGIANGCGGGPPAGRYSVELPWGVAYLSASSVSCPSAAALPVVERVGRLAERELAQALLQLYGMNHEMGAASGQRIAEKSSDVFACMVGGELPTIDRGAIQGAMESFGDIGMAEGCFPSGAGVAAARALQQDPLHRAQQEVQRLGARARNGQSGQVAEQGYQQLNRQAQQLRDTGVTQLDELKAHGARFAQGVTADDALREKASSLLVSLSQRVDRAIVQHSPALAAQAGSGAATLAVSCAGGVQRCVGLLQIELERRMVEALRAEGDRAEAGAQLLDRLSEVSGDPALLASMSSGDALAVVDALNVGAPAGARRALAQDRDRAAGDALVDAANCDSMSGLIQRATERGSALMSRVESMAENAVVVATLENLGSEELHRDALDGFQRFEPDAFLRDADVACQSAEGRQIFADRLLNVCLDCLLRVVPKTRIPEASGTHQGISFKLFDINMSGVQFRKDDVNITLQNGDWPGSQSALHQGTVDVFQLVASNVSARFEHLRCKLKPKMVPEVSLVTNAKADGIVVRMHFAMRSQGGQAASLFVKNMKVSMQFLDITLDNSRYATLFNPLVSHLRQFLKNYISSFMEVSLAEPVNHLCGALNDILQEAGPLMSILGWSVQPPAPAPSPCPVAAMFSL